MDKLLTISGVPARYLSVEFDVRRAVRRCQYRRSWVAGGQEPSITIARQQQTIDQLLTDPPPRGIIGIGAVPTDDYAMVLATQVLRGALARDKRCRVSMQNLANPLPSTQNPRIVVVHNVTPRSHEVRKQICRDRITQYHDSLVLVVVGGVSPVTFFYEHLHVPLDTAIYFEGDDENL